MSFLAANNTYRSIWFAAKGFYEAVFVKPGILGQPPARRLSSSGVEIAERRLIASGFTSKRVEAATPQSPASIRHGLALRARPGDQRLLRALANTFECERVEALVGA